MKRAVVLISDIFEFSPIVGSFSYAGNSPGSPCARSSRGLGSSSVASGEGGLSLTLS